MQEPPQGPELQQKRATRGARLPRFSLDRPITVVVLLVSVLVVGAVAGGSIPIELFPSGYTAPSLSVWVPWRDAPPREVLEKISEPLEEELSTVRGIDRLRSRSRTGASSISIRFKQGTDMNLAYREVRDRIERARRQFPSDVDRVYTFKHDTSDFPVYLIGVAVDTSVVDVYNLIQKQIVRPFERTEGVAKVEVNGLEEKEILIEIDRDRAQASGLNIYQLAQELAGDNFTMASGHVRDANRKLLLRSVARYKTVEDVGNILVAPNVRLRDVATIKYEEPEKKYRVRAMSRPAYAIIVFKEGEANTREVCGRLQAVFETYADNPRLAAVESIVIFDQKQVIDESLRTLGTSGMIGGVIAACVLLFFLRRVRVMLVVNLAIPLSLIVALAVMFFAGETLNLLSLLALMVCVGLLVDNSVVVAENIDRLHKTGLTRREACIGGATEIALAITMSTLTTVVVFLPVALVEGPAQFFLLRMAIPISVALLASLIVALVTIPLGTYVTLPHAGQPGARGTASGHFARILERGYDASFGRLDRVYNAMLAVWLRRRIDLVFLILAAFGVTVFLAFVQKDENGKSRMQFVDVQDEERGGFEIDVEMPQNFTLEETEEWFLQAEKIVEEHAEELGLEGWFLWHMKTFGELEGWFTNPRTSKLTPRQVTERVVELVPKRPGMKLRTGQESEFDDNNDKGVYSVSIVGNDPESLNDVAAQLEDLFMRVPGVIGVRRDDNELAPNELALVIDRERAQRYGVDPRAVAYVVGYALRGQSLPKHRDEGREVPVRVRFKEEDRESLAQLASFLVPTAEGELLPLDAVTDVRFLSTPQAIVKLDKRITRAVTVDLAEEEQEEARAMLGFLVNAIDLPEGVSFSDRVARQRLNEDLQGLIFAGSLSVVFIYLLMGLLFESFILPLSIILTIPLAILGVLWIHMAFGFDIDFLGNVGIVLLIGVVVNNGIVLIDYVNRLRREGVDRTRAILLAADRRFRPIMMTAITTIGGMVPLAIGGRMDSGISYTSFAMTLIGGMTTATLLTLLVVPVFYTFFDDVRVKFGAALKRVLLRRGAQAETWSAESPAAD
jgi:HAE1 family hydrophobic/amphiphilic exporter-1